MEIFNFVLPYLEVCAIGLIMIIVSLHFCEKMAPNDDNFSRKNYAIIVIIIISRKTKF
jgi:hypothetical protein